LFGGTGMNIMNPALCCRAFLFFSFPAQMSGEIWAGTNPTVVRKSLLKMNQDAGLSSLDGFSQATPLAKYNIGMEVKRIHVDAIASNNAGLQIPTADIIQKQLEKWNIL